MSFSHSSHFTIQGQNTLNHVYGDQISCTVNANAVHYNGLVAAEHTEFDEFEYVKRGHIVAMREVGTMKITEMKWRNGALYAWDRNRKKVYSIELIGRQSTFTALVYEGEDAHRFWEEDFQQCSRTRNARTCQLFGINRSEVPMLIFHHDLVPLAHFYIPTFWKNLYVEWLRKQMRCWEEYIWLDTNKGVLCSGPFGPFVPSNRGVVYSQSNTIIVPSTVEMLKDNLIFEFFRQFKSRTFQRWIVGSAYSYSEVCRIDSQFIRTDMANHTSERLDREQIDLELYFPDKPRQEVLDSMYKLRFDTIYSTSLDAVARLPQEAGLEWHWGSGDYGLADRKPVGNELIRFTLASADDDDIFVAAKYDCEDIRGMSWLSQFSRCVEASENEDYFVIKPVYPTLQSTGSRGEREILADFFKLCDSEVPPPIYLFVYPVAFTTMAEVFSWVDGHTHSHYWSMDKAGLCKMTEDELEFWGVPKLVPSISFNHHLTLISWPTSIYATLHNWQLFQGFEPSTAAFAHYIGYPELEILQTEICSDKGKQQEFESENTLWEAIPGSGISAFR